MTYASVSNALVALFTNATTPPFTTVTRGDEFRLGNKGSVVPTPDRTPALLISRTLRQRGKEQIMTQEGTSFRFTPLLIDIWDYLDDPPLATDSFQDLVEQAQALVRVHYQLHGTANTATTKLLRLRVLGDEPTARPIGVNNGRSQLHAAFVVEAWEAVTAVLEPV